MSVLEVECERWSARGGACADLQVVGGVGRQAGGGAVVGAEIGAGGRGLGGGRGREGLWLTRV